MELRQLRYFVAVAEELHFARAAARLDLAQSPLSRQIRGLELELGVQLFERSTRSVALTSAGQVLLREARLTLAQADRAVAATQQAQRGEVGELRLGFVTSAVYDVLPRLLLAYRVRFPEVEITPRHMNVNEQLAALQERRLHAGIVRAPVQGRRFATELLREDPIVLALPRAHPLATRETLQIRDLEDEHFIFLRRTSWSGFHDEVISMCRRAGFSPRITEETNDMVNLLGLVASGVGVGFAPASAHQLRSEAVVWRPIEDATASVDVLLAWNREETSPLLPGLLDVARRLRAALTSSSGGGKSAGSADRSRL